MPPTQNGAIEGILWEGLYQEVRLFVMRNPTFCPMLAGDRIATPLL
jgi:hypothetical protein